MKSIAISIFVAIGGVGILVHLGVKYTPEYIKKGLMWLINKYPALRAFVAAHGDDFKTLAKGIEQVEEEVVDAAAQPPTP